VYCTVDCIADLRNDVSHDINVIGLYRPIDTCGMIEGANENAGMETARRKTQDWKMRDCPLWKAKMHLSAIIGLYLCECMQSPPLSLSLRVFTSLSAVGTLFKVSGLRLPSSNFIFPFLSLIGLFIL